MSSMMSFTIENSNNVLWLVTDKICGCVYDANEKETTIWCGGSSEANEFVVEGDCVKTIQDAICHLHDA